MALLIPPGRVFELSRGLDLRIVGLLVPRTHTIPDPAVGSHLLPVHGSIMVVMDTECAASRDSSRSRVAYRIVSRNVSRSEVPRLAHTAGSEGVIGGRDRPRYPVEAAWAGVRRRETSRRSKVEHEPEGAVDGSHLLRADHPSAGRQPFSRDHPKLVATGVRRVVEAAQSRV